MKASFSFVAALAALSLVACKESTSVSGTVYDPFTGEAVEMPTVWVQKTAFTSDKIPDGLPNGKFQFDKIKEGTYTISAGKNRYSKTNVEFTVDEKNPNPVVDLFIYNREGRTSGMYLPPQGAPSEKISNDWVTWEATGCKASLTALKYVFVTEVINPKNKKKEKREQPLPDPRTVAADFKVLFYNASSVSSVPDATSYPVRQAKGADLTDCRELNPKENLLAPQLDKGSALNVAYKSENLYEITGTLPKGRQLLTIVQDGKLLNTYFLNVR
jgi:hypothetical protein